MFMLLLIEISSDSCSNDSGGVNLILAVLLGIAIVVLVISIVIIVFLVVQRKQSRCGIPSIYFLCRYS